MARWRLAGASAGRQLLRACGPVPSLLACSTRRMRDPLHGWPWPRLREACRPGSSGHFCGVLWLPTTRCSPSCPHSNAHLWWMREAGGHVEAGCLALAQVWLGALWPGLQHLHQLVIAVSASAVGDVSRPLLGQPPGRHLLTSSAVPVLSREGHGHYLAQGSQHSWRVLSCHKQALCCLCGYIDDGLEGRAAWSSGSRWALQAAADWRSSRGPSSWCPGWEFHSAVGPREAERGGGTVQSPAAALPRSLREPCELWPSTVSKHIRPVTSWLCFEPQVQEAPKLQSDWGLTPGQGCASVLRTSSSGLGHQIERTEGATPSAGRCAPMPSFVLLQDTSCLVGVWPSDQGSDLHEVSTSSSQAGPSAGAGLSQAGCVTPLVGPPQGVSRVMPERQPSAVGPALRLSMTSLCAGFPGTPSHRTCPCCERP